MNTTEDIKAAAAKAVENYSRLVGATRSDDSLYTNRAKGFEERLAETMDVDELQKLATQVTSRIEQLQIILHA